MKRLLEVGVLAMFAAIIFAGSTFADFKTACESKYPDLEFVADDDSFHSKKIYCTTYYDNSIKYKIYADRASGCQQASMVVSHPETCSDSASQSETSVGGNIESGNNSDSSNSVLGMKVDLDTIVVILTIALCVSMVLNIVLVILLFKKKNVDIVVQSTPNNAASEVPTNSASGTSKVDVEQIYPTREQD